MGTKPKHPSCKCARGYQHNVHITRFTIAGHCLALPMPKPISVPINRQSRSWPKAICRDDSIVLGLDRTQTAYRDRPPDLTFTLLEICYYLGKWHRNCGSGSVYNPSDGRPSPPPRHILDIGLGMVGIDLRTFLMTSPVRPTPYSSLKGYHK